MSSLSEFSIELAQSLVESSEQFPIDFDDAWQWLEYSTKGNAVRALLRLEEDLDYVVFIINDKNSEGRPSKGYRLTVDAFKHLAMMSETSKGKQVRMYFLECERIAKARVAPKTVMPALKERAEEIEYVIDVFEKLGGMDDRDRLFLKDYIRDAQNLLPPADNKRREYPISDRLVERGIKSTKSLLVRVGNIAAQFYEKKHGRKPAKREQYVDGTTRRVNIYCEDDLPILDAAIDVVMRIESIA